MTTLTDTQVITASGGLVELGFVQRTTDYTISSTTVSGAADVFSTDLTFVSDGSPVLVDFSCGRLVTTSGGPYINIYLVDGSGNSSGMLGLLFPGGTQAPGFFRTRLQLAAGTYSYNVRAVYNTAGGAYLTAGDGVGGNQIPAFLRVSKIVQATQWPAVTTGTIICTSSTRPGSPFEGQTIYETDTDLSLTWSGSTWVQVGSLGAWTTWTPTITQVGSVTHSVVYGRYTKIGRTVYANFTTNVTGSGSAGTGVSISLPVTSAAGSPLRLGSGHIYDTSTATRYTGMCELDSTTAFRIVGDWSSGNQWGGIPSVGLASGDQVSASITYEAAS